MVWLGHGEKEINSSPETGGANSKLLVNYVNLLRLYSLLLFSTFVQVSVRFVQATVHLTNYLSIDIFINRATIEL